MGCYKVGYYHSNFITIAKSSILPVDALTEAVAEFHIDDVFVLAAAIPSAVFLQALDSYEIIAKTLYGQVFYVASVTAYTHRELLVNSLPVGF